MCVCVSLLLPGSGTLCASWQCLEVPRGPPPSLAVQFVGSGTSLSGLDVELVGSRYRMSLVKKRFATGEGLKLTHTHGSTHRFLILLSFIICSQQLSEGTSVVSAVCSDKVLVI